MYMWSVCLCELVHYIHADVRGGQKRVLDILELELQMVVCQPVWMLETKLM